MRLITENIRQSAENDLRVPPLEFLAVFAQHVSFRDRAEDLADRLAIDDGEDVRLSLRESRQNAADRRAGQDHRLTLASDGVHRLVVAVGGDVEVGGLGEAGIAAVSLEGEADHADGGCEHAGAEGRHAGEGSGARLYRVRSQERTRNAAVELTRR